MVMLLAHESSDDGEDSHRYGAQEQYFLHCDEIAQCNPTIIRCPLNQLSLRIPPQFLQQFLQ